ncbi:hypothetical protein D9M72_645970 [compost metagenome]
MVAGERVAPVFEHADEATFGDVGEGRFLRDEGKAEAGEAGGKPVRQPAEDELSVDADF